MSSRRYDDALFHDPVHDGATDPTVIRHHLTGEWWMYYTQRRASVDEPGVAWVHGSRIGVARSVDGVRWRFDGTVDDLRLGDDAGKWTETHWAPEVIFDGERYRMYLTVIDGIPDRWEGHARRIVEYVSDDLASWRLVGEVPLSSDRVIDACVSRCPDGLWRMWVKDEADDSTTWVAASDDLAPRSWRVEGRAIGGRPHEGPNVFELGGWWWMLVDEWRGMGVHRSADAVTWERQGGPDDVILGAPGRRRGDATFGRHGDVVAGRGRGILFYFTHPHWDGSELGSTDAASARRSAIFAAPLEVVDGVLTCDRDAPVDLGSITD
ncbi:glycosyl hydrolase [Agromyces luteolus]|uniref:Family 43 glycosylhydrolase n=1 Tax=Agromyces luteolus TaxID=88373 RepID=A0A7C9HRV6_9MICO|nr:family 43 glycosylhydrolase [Agromyces luteolus]MUN07869.1 family 43 glycosylhydrolase [Agromyces luteolus]GLK29220.1 glycosyl hydrolase [Agromyces luteolus]